MRANGNGETFSYLPYGEERTATADGRVKFGTYFRDSSGVAAQDYADQRYYNPWYGRFNTPDRSKGINPADPITWNKYAYVGGDPVNHWDPSGQCEPQPGTDVCFEGGNTPPDPSPPGPDPVVLTWTPQMDVTGLGVAAANDIAAQVAAAMAAARAGAQAVTILNAERGAADRLFNPDCAGLFLPPAENTAANRAALSSGLDALEDGGSIRTIDPLAAGTQPNVPAFTTSAGGLIYVVSGGPFFTGQVNGQPLGGFASGMTLADFQELVILHEFLHYEGIVGPDTGGQRYTLPNGDTVKGSVGISKEVKKDCFK